MARTENIVERAKEIVCELSGYEPDEILTTSSFLEQGFDSLFLTILSSAFHKEFGIEVTFRQLFDELSTLASLASHLDALLPQDAYQDKPAPSDPPSDVPSTIISNDQKQIESHNFEENEMVGIGNVPPGNINAVIAEQMRLMSLQLDILNQGGNYQIQIPPEQPQEMAIDTLSGQAEDTEIKTPGTEKPKLPPGFGPQVDGNTDQKQLEPELEDYLQKLITRYTSKTATSKKLTLTYRPFHADPRTAAGFNLRWKEMVYPIITERSAGSKLWDVDGNEYIDLLNGFGPNFLGHSPPFITEALEQQLCKGIEIGPQTPLAGEVAEMICDFTGMERVTFVNTGSEAVQAAIRVARTVTSRDMIVVFDKDYHGNFDEVLIKGLKMTSAPKTLPLAPGIPRSAVENIMVLEYGSNEALDIIALKARSIAGVLVEPMQSRRPEYQPVEFVKQLRKLTEEEGIVLIFDEVITGFRTSPGGAQEYYGIQADLATYGKVIGGGMPIGVVAGRARFMDTFDGGMWHYGDDSFPSAGVTFFAGTFVRHPLAIAAAHATLVHMKKIGPELQNRVNRKTKIFCAKLNRMFKDNGLSIFMSHFSSQTFIRFEERHELASLFFYHLREKGIHLLEGFPTYITDAHTEEDLENVLNAFKETIDEMQAVDVFSKPVLDSPAEFELTESQHEIWIASQMGDEASCAFNESDTICLEGSIFLPVLQEAAAYVLSRHTAMNVSFREDGTTQKQNLDLDHQIPVHDIRELSRKEQDEVLNKHIKISGSTPFDLEQGPLVNISLFQFDGDLHYLVIYGHHIVFDGWSSDLILREITEVYSAMSKGTDFSLPSPASFFDYTVEMNSLLDNDTGTQDLEYWLGILKGGKPFLDLPTDYSRAQERNYRGNTLHFEPAEKVRNDARIAAASGNVSLYAVLLSSFAILLSRLSRREDIVIGIPLAGQASGGKDTLVGYCVNLLPIRLYPSKEKTYGQFLTETKNAILDAYEHQVCSLGRIKRELELPQDRGGGPLVDVIFNFSSYFSDLSTPSIKIRSFENPRQFVAFEMFLNIVETENSLILDWDYKTALFKQESISRWVEYLVAIIDEVSDNPDQQLGNIEMLSATERRKLLVDWNRTETPLPTSQCVHRLFEQQAGKTPNKPAVVFNDEVLTYKQLEVRSNQLARYLLEKGVKPNDLVGINVERSSSMVVGLMGILKTGAAYVPLDPYYPPERLEYMISDTNMEVLLTQEKLVEHLPRYNGQSICMDSEWNHISERDETPVEVFADPDQLAYVIYTSGSTGKPKGVKVHHRAVVNFLESMAERPGLNPDDILLAVTTLSFDIAVLELFLPIIKGATIIVLDQESTVDGEVLANKIRDHNVTIMQATPSTWRLLLGSSWEGSKRLKVLCGGEPMPKDLASTLTQKAASVWNMYGPTETTVWSTCHQIEGDQDKILVGRPINNTTVFIVDEAMQPTPAGVAGEILIGGTGVTKGYLNRPELTREQFVNDPFEENDDAILYKTGDLGCYKDDGLIECLGRIDTQVKVRGSRIELGEIEAIMEAYPEIKQAIAGVQEFGPEDHRLIGYFILEDEGNANSADIREHLRKQLPDYMIPQHYLQMNTFPLTPAGKVDRKNLPAFITGQTDEVTYKPPTTPLEEKIAAIWSEVLKTERIGIEDNFFDIGGHSLLGMQVINRLRKEFELNLSVATIFETPTVDLLAALIEDRRSKNHEETIKNDLSSKEREVFEI